MATRGLEIFLNVTISHLIKQCHSGTNPTPGPARVHRFTQGPLPPLLRIRLGWDRQLSLRYSFARRVFPGLCFFLFKNVALCGSLLHTVWIEDPTLTLCRPSVLCPFTSMAAVSPEGRQCHCSLTPLHPHSHWAPSL